MRQFLYLVIISAKKRKEKEGHSDMSGDKSKKKSKRSFSSGTTTRHTHRSSLFLTNMFTSHVAYVSMMCRGNWTEEYNVQFCEKWTNTSSSGSVGSGAWYVTFLFM
jgi:hypothetical protein